MSTVSREVLRSCYQEAAQAYLRSLPLEHFMEANAQGTQRKISLASLEQVRGARPDVHVFNELLVQYRRAKRTQKIEQVVPDNMVVIHDGELTPDTSYDLELQPAHPFMMLEYVSKRNKRKDYEENHQRYDEELKVPYYLLFYPDNEDLSLFHLRRGRYASVTPNDQGRLAIPELEVEVALLNGWVRYWFRGDLLPLPADWQREMNAVRRQLAAERRRADKEVRRAAEPELQVEELRAQLARMQKRIKNGK
jgi:Uma2 family endonuclease